MSGMMKRVSGEEDERDTEDEFLELWQRVLDLLLERDECVVQAREERDAVYLLGVLSSPGYGTKFLQLRFSVGGMKGTHSNTGRQSLHILTPFKNFSSSPNPNTASSLFLAPPLPLAPA